MTQTSTHLSEEALDDLLIGMGSSDSEAHLKACDKCRAKLQQFQSDISLFNKASMAWTESRTPRLRERERRVLNVPSLLLQLCAMALLLITLGLPTFINIQHKHAPDKEAGSDQGESQEQIAQDNELMKNVEAAINPDEASIVNQYRLMESPSLHSRPQPK